MTGKYEEERNLDKSVQGEYDRLDTGNNCILEGTFIACIFVSATVILTKRHWLEIILYFIIPFCLLERACPEPVCA